MAEIEDAVKELGVSSSDSLYERLGAYSLDFQVEPGKYAEPGADVAVDASIAGPLEDARDIGKRILKRWNKVLYDITCDAGQADPEVRKSLLSAFKLNSPEAIAAAITGVLISVFSVAPAIAVLVGVLLGRVLLPAAGEEVCQFWKERV